MILVTFFKKNKKCRPRADLRGSCRKFHEKRGENFVRSHTLCIILYSLLLSIVFIVTWWMELPTAYTLQLWLKEFNGLCPRCSPAVRLHPSCILLIFISLILSLCITFLFLFFIHTPLGKVSFLPKALRIKSILPTPTPAFCFALSTFCRISTLDGFLFLWLAVRADEEASKTDPIQG